MNKLPVRITLLCLIILLGSLIPVYAQEPDEQEETIVIAPTGQLNLTFKQLGHATKRLTRDSATRWYRIDLPGNFQVSATGNYLDLITSHLPETPDKPSVLQIEMNGRLLSAFSLSADNAVTNTVRINLPADLLRAGYNYIRVELNTSATCEDPGAIVNVLVDENSTLSFGYQQTSYQTDLALYPFPFVEKSLLQIPVTIVLPDTPTSSDLSAAATVAAGLGQMSGGDIDLTAVLASDLDSDIQSNNHLIVIGQPDDHALFDELKLPLSIDSTTIEQGQGILQEIVSPWNKFRLVLIVSGLDDEGVSKASHALNRETHFLSMRGPVAIVTQLLPVSKSTIPRTSSMTLASLGYEDEVVYGAEPQNYTFDLTLPLGWQLEAVPVFVLRFSHAEILDPYESVIDIHLNGVPVGSTLLDESNVTAGELTVSLPGRLLKSGRNRLQVGVEMNFPAASRDKCRDLLDERAWTVLSSESEVFLPYNTIALPPDLRFFPYPFSQTSGLDQTLFVLPDQPSPHTFNYLIQLAVRLGSAATSPEYISAHAVYASEVNANVQRNKHLILFGRPTENTLFSEVNAYLPHPFIPGSDLLEPLIVDSVVLLPDPERDAGLLEITDSPWSEKHSLLAITGTTDEGIRLAVQTLLEQTGRLKGNLAIIEPAFTPLSDEPNQVSIYSIDTRPPASNEETSMSDATSENDLALLAERWWK